MMEDNPINHINIGKFEILPNHYDDNPYDRIETMEIITNDYALIDFNELDASVLANRGMDTLRYGTLIAMNMYSLPFDIVMNVQYTLSGEVLNYVIDELQDEFTPDDRIDWSANIYRTDDATDIQVGLVEYHFINGGPTITVVN